MQRQTLRLLSSTASIVFSVLATQASAQMFNAVQLHAAAPGQSGGMLGVAALSTPEYQGSAKNRKLIVPVVDYQWANGWFAGGSNGLGYNFSGDPMFHYGVRVTGDIGRKEKRAKLLRGLGDIDAKSEIGAFFTFNPGAATYFGSSVRYGAGNDNKGMLFDLSAGYTESWNRNLRAGASLGASYANDNYMQSFFGISQAQAARSAHKIYTPKAGLKNTYVSAFVSYMINDRTSLNLIVTSDRLAGDAKSSPLSEKTRTSSIVAAAAYRF